jgi:poly-beta-1,6-N-acetyl-D-glucosamine biosynthesis protein PgaD
MSHSLIINVRKQLHWQRRLFSDAGTAMLWGFWLWLCRPVVGALSWMLGLRLGVQHSLVQVLALSAPVSVERTALALCSTSGTLVLWNLVRERRNARPRVHCIPDYASYFGLSEQDLQKCRESQVSVVHHNEQGQILRIESMGRSKPPPGNPCLAGGVDGPHPATPSDVLI